jgi:hypothetical protein
VIPVIVMRSGDGSGDDDMFNGTYRFAAALARMKTGTESWSTS